ncbi:Hypothetical predicted protein [Olea europaea subsp. europaea]|uniref:Uncharacterized protein n=1 Tax=Olea europaea subsp. europaea TaxID=158383 RepID=A0A8S0T646_OLEEU|nr:Hypothetical predicted protein [Olea europaea subsp. europaea]
MQQNHHKNHSISPKKLCWVLQHHKNLHSNELEGISDPLSPCTLTSTTEPLDVASPHEVDTVCGSVMSKVHRMGPTSEEHRTPHSTFRVAVAALTSPSSWVAIGVGW